MGEMADRGLHVRLAKALATDQKAVIDLHERHAISYVLIETGSARPQHVLVPLTRSFVCTLAAIEWLAHITPAPHSARAQPLLRDRASSWLLITTRSGASAMEGVSSIIALPSLRRRAIKSA